MSDKKKDSKKTDESSRIHLPMLAPPKIMEEAYKRWYRIASDISQLQGTYFDDDDEEPESSQRPPRPERVKWGNQVEFLMSCIATSVGLGNVWRFSFTAYQNGGGAFLIPYIIVLLIIGKPMYYLECALGQFSSRNSVRVWSLCPGMKGTGYAQTLSIGCILSYYVAIVSLCLYYLVMSFQSTLPWATCNTESTHPDWKNCVPSDASLLKPGDVKPENATSSAELYFKHTVLQQVNGIDDGIGAPVWYLTVGLLVAWLIIFMIVAQGVKSSGKAAYFLALFPYVVMIILLITTCTLNGVGEGMLFFITPQWDRLLDLDVWYAAVTQVFFSLTVGTGPIIMFSSYNGFASNVYRDSLIVTTLDTFTSLLSGLTIFGILGNLAYELQAEISDVVGTGGTGLAFVSYPDAIAKTFMPQIFSVLFFTMMVVLGIGSAVAFLSTINTVFLDAFPNIPTIYISFLTCTLGFASGLVYVTPGGQYLLELVDYYGATFLALFCAICEIVGVAWIYGLENFCLDLEFMLNKKTSMYWRACWGIFTPAIMITVFSYALVKLDSFTFAGVYRYPTLAYVAGYCLLFGGVIFVPFFICVVIYKKRTGKCCESIKKAFQPKVTWGPRDLTDRKHWRRFRKAAKRHQDAVTTSKLRHIWLSLTGGYRRNL